MLPSVEEKARTKASGTLLPATCIDIYIYIYIYTFALGEAGLGGRGAVSAVAARLLLLRGQRTAINLKIPTAETPDRKLLRSVFYPCIS